MKKLFQSRLVWLLLGLLIGFLLSGCKRSAQGLEGYVVQVSDGDTIVVEVDGKQERVRLIGVDAPEKAQRPWGPRATAFTKSLVLGKTVRLELDVQERDKYGRLLSYVYVACPEPCRRNGTFVNLELLKSGHAVLYTVPPNVKHVEEFTQAQVEAREKGVGIWSPTEGLTETPKAFRKRGQPRGLR